MRVAGREVLQVFMARHADVRAAGSAWLAEAELSRWTSPHDIKIRYPSASLLADNIVIFNLKGNKYRLETLITYVPGIVLIRWAGTHAEYSKRY